VSRCPGFGQDRVNFHRTPGRGTAGGSGLTPSGQTEPGIPYHVPSRWVPVGWGGRAAPVRSERAGFVLSCFLLICTVLFLFPLFAVLFKLPLSRPTGFCLFLFILLRLPAGGGPAVWRFCCRRAAAPNYNI